MAAQTVWVKVDYLALDEYDFTFVPGNFTIVLKDAQGSRFDTKIIGEQQLSSVFKEIKDGFGHLVGYGYHIKYAGFAISEARSSRPSDYLMLSAYQDSDGKERQFRVWYELELPFGFVPVTQVHGFGFSAPFPDVTFSIQNTPARQGSLPYTLDQVYALSQQDPIGNPIRDFDGNPHGFTGSFPALTERSYKYQGQADVNGDGHSEQVFTNRVSGRWATVSVDPVSGQVDYSRHGSNGSTRVVGIYIDPLVAEGEAHGGRLLSGEVAPKRFGPFDSQQRFQNDLRIDNLQLRASADYNRDGLMETYWKVLDGTAYLHAYMHADGNIQYANYQNFQQMKDYLAPLGFEEVFPLIAA